MRKLSIIAAFLVVVGGILFLVYSVSVAQIQSTAQTLEVSPPSQEIEVDPGKTITVTAKIRNATHETLPIKARVEDFTAQGEEGQVALTEKGPWSITSWTTITPSEFTLKGGEQKTVTATIKLPADGVAGGRYGSFVFAVDPGVTGGNATSITQEIASLFLLRVSGPVTEQLTLISFDAPRFSEFGPIPFDLKFRNDGNVHVKTAGIINVLDMFGQKTADVVVDATNVFPGASRVVHGTLKNKFLFGQYTATAIMYYGSIKNQTLTAQVKFIVLPVRLIAVAVVVLFLTFLLRKRLARAFKVLFG